MPFEDGNSGKREPRSVNKKIEERLQFCSGLPSLPAVAIKVIELANDPAATMSQISDHVSLDPALAAKLLKVANSPLYQTRRTPSNVRQAVSLMGTHAAIMIALSFSLARSFTRQHRNGIMDTSAFWRRSILSGLACRAVGQQLKLKSLDDLFLAGLLQDIGILVFNALMPEDYQPLFSAAPDHEALLAAERKSFDCGHDEVGHWLLKRWNLPDYLAAACLTSHQRHASAAPDLSLPACVAVSGWIADLFLAPDDYAAALRAGDEARARLGLDEQELAQVMDTIRGGLPAVEELFDIAIGAPECAAITEQARELQVVHNLIKVRELEEKAQRDALTGVHNRGFFDEALRREFDLSTRHGWPLSLVLIDLDHFKAVNDTYGHQAGDSVLVSVVRTVLGQIRHDDILARYGGEEFALILPGTGQEAATRLLLRLRDSIAGQLHVQEDGKQITVTVSIGLAAHMDDRVSFERPEEMLKAADQALYSAKHAGRNQLITWTADAFCD